MPCCAWSLWRLRDPLLQRRLSVGTVDSIQGQERDIIAITLTRSNPQGEIGFLSDIRRMNVGMTRARRMRWPR
jgi:ATP-dependent RNA/DNA helicase IGHMBP2